MGKRLPTRCGFSLQFAVVPCETTTTMISRVIQSVVRLCSRRRIQWMAVGGDDGGESSASTMGHSSSARQRHP